jgi:hypothetical protein
LTLNSSPVFGLKQPRRPAIIAAVRCPIESVLVVFLSALLFETGCQSPPTTGPEPSPTQKELSSQGIALGAITAFGGGESVCSDVMARRIEAEIITARPSLHMAPLESIKNSLQTNEYRQALKEISEGIEPSSPDLVLFDSLTNAFRYVLLVDCRGRSEVDGHHWVSALVANLSWTLIFHEYPDLPAPGYHKFNVVFIFNIFDLQTHRLVWTASEYHTLKHPLSEDLDAALPQSALPEYCGALISLAPKLARQLPK